MPLFAAALCALLMACSGHSRSTLKQLRVTVTAYNSVTWQTKAGNPSVAAWGDTLKPGMRALAVSRDLEKLGLKHGQEVYIQGVPGRWVVLDRMHYRFRKRVDLYMGRDVKAAKDWGIRKRIITWSMADSHKKSPAN